jgi:hypothetical protein
MARVREALHFVVRDANHDVPSVGRVMGEAMQRIGQSAVMGQLIAGILLGPSVFGAIWPEAQRAVFASPQQQSMIDAIFRQRNLDHDQYTRFRGSIYCTSLVSVWACTGR